jgi:hypothetical protein
MNTSISRLLVAAMALALTAGVADAAHKKHKRIVRHHYPLATEATAAYPYANYARGPRPPWAAPWQCFTDEGYGRYRPCDAGPGPTR